MQTPGASLPSSLDTSPAMITLHTSVTPSQGESLHLRCSASNKVPWTRASSTHRAGSEATVADKSPRGS